MTTYLPLRFLQEKITELQTALFFSTTDSVLKIPVYVVKALTVDEIGQIWFLIPAPVQKIQEFDKEFHVRLDFFKKAKEFYIKILGKAFIVTDPEEINHIATVSDDIKKQVLDSKLMLIKVKIQNADYFSPAVKKVPFSLKKLLLQFYNFVFNREREYRANPRQLTPLGFNEGISFN